MLRGTELSVWLAQSSITSDRGKAQLDTIYADLLEGVVYYIYIYIHEHKNCWPDTLRQIWPTLATTIFGTGLALGMVGRSTQNSGFCRRSEARMNFEFYRPSRQLLTQPGDIGCRDSLAAKFSEFV
jgi:hypothetical protein